jgi:hypothetical protein
MKKIFTLFAAAAFALSMQASIYIVGSNPFGNWDTANGTEMTDNGDGTYTLTAQISESIWFVFANNLTAESGDWDTFNTQYRYGPTGGDQTVNVNEWMETQLQGNGDGAYMLVVPEGGAEYTFTFDEFTLQFKVDGEKGDDGYKSFTVAGSAASVFGTTWDPSNTDNDMVQNADGLWILDKYNCELPEGNLEFKVAANHGWAFAWPAENYQVYIPEPGYYDVHITFDSTTYEVTGTAELVGEPLPPEPIEAMYVLGEVNDMGWAPNTGVAMTTEDKLHFTTEVMATGANEEEGVNYSYFSFTSKLAESADDWGAINASRLGAIEDGYTVSEDMMGMPLALTKGSNSFKVPSGKKYILEVNVEDLNAMTVTIKEGSSVNELAAGKAVAGVSYYNVMGQQMQEANGVTIVVTRYTDGSMSTSKVIK